MPHAPCWILRSLQYWVTSFAILAPGHLDPTMDWGWAIHLLLHRTRGGSSPYLSKQLCFSLFKIVFWPTILIEKMFCVHFQ